MLMAQLKLQLQVQLQVEVNVLGVWKITLCQTNIQFDYSTLNREVGRGMLSGGCM